MIPELPFFEKCKKYLYSRWNYIQTLTESENIIEPISNDYNALKSKIKDCLVSNTKSYRYVLPTQLLSKSVDHTLDCRSLQVADNSVGSFDARTIAHKVIVPFDKDNYNVLGGSNEPYVNNPLRCTSVSIVNRNRQRNKTDWDKLISILDIVQGENDVNFTKDVFDQVLFEIYNLLSDVVVIYPTPHRISIDQSIDLINKFISERSGGVRLETVTAALFRTISEKFDLFDKVKREKVNASYTSSGMVADIECWLNNKRGVLIL